jgi:AraC-like DNA-binding protein
MRLDSSIGPLARGARRGHDGDVSRHASWLGRIFLSPTRLLYAGILGPTDMHAHHAFQIAVAAEGELTFSDGTATASGRAAMIPPDAPHRVAAPARAVMLYIDPDDLVGRKLRRLEVAPDDAGAWFAAGRRWSIGAFSMPASRDEADAIERALLTALVGDSVRPRPIHPAVTKALKLIPQQLEGDIRIAEVAQTIGLSAGRLQHLFSQEVGIPFRPYVLWLRMQRAAATIRDGASFTDAAHAAGFADSSHMNHAFKRMFGLTPSDVFGSVEWVL